MLIFFFSVWKFRWKDTLEYVFLIFIEGWEKHDKEKVWVLILDFKVKLSIRLRCDFISSSEVRVDRIELFRDSCWKSLTFFKIIVFSLLLLHDRLGTRLNFSRRSIIHAGSEGGLCYVLGAGWVAGPLVCPCHGAFVVWYSILKWVRGSFSFCK